MTHNNSPRSSSPRPSAAPQGERFEARLQALEASSRRWRLASLSLVLLVAVALLTGASLRPAVPDVLAARQFSLVDEEGNVRAQWRLGDAGAEIASYAVDGSLLGVSSALGAGGAAPAPQPQPSAQEGKSVIKLGPPDDLPEDDETFDWAD